MHITSLPSKYGIGVMGEETKRFIRRIKDMGFSYWQVLPLCPTDFYGSPYASPAAFALSPLLIDPDTLKNDGFVSEDDLARSVYYGSPYTADYEFAAKSRRELLKIAYQNKKNEVSAETENSARRTRGAKHIRCFAPQRKNSAASRGMSGMKNSRGTKMRLKTETS